MKHIIIVIVCIFFTKNIAAQEIKWRTMNEVAELMKTEPRKVMMDVYTTWCGPCKMLDKNTFRNPDVVKYINENYYAIKFNAEGNSPITYKGRTFANPRYDAKRKGRRNAQHQFAQYLSVKAYPTMIFFDDQLNLIAPIASYLTPRQLEIYLKLFKTDAYKKVNSKEAWEKYQKEFKHTFKN